MEFLRSGENTCLSCFCWGFQRQGEWDVLNGTLASTVALARGFNAVTSGLQLNFPKPGEGSLVASPLLLLPCSVAGALLLKLDQNQAPLKVLGKSSS